MRSDSLVVLVIFGVTIQVAVSAISSRQLNRPTCSTNCISKLDLDGCDATDNACLCKSHTFINGFTTCVDSACLEKDRTSALSLAQGICDVIGVPVTLTTSSSVSSTITGVIDSSTVPSHSSSVSSSRITSSSRAPSSSRTATSSSYFTQTSSSTSSVSSTTSVTTITSSSTTRDSIFTSAALSLCSESGSTLVIPPALCTTSSRTSVSGVNTITTPANTASTARINLLNTLVAFGVILIAL